MIGSMLISLAFASATISLVAYLMLLRRHNDRVQSVARVGFHATVATFMCAVAALLSLILTHQFQYEYVWAHSSTNLSTPLLIASFYAGQEGSFMLWTLGVATIGIAVLGYAQRVRYEAPAMATYMAVMTLLLLILVVQSPFLTLHQAFPEQNLPAGFIPEQGKGMNPSLENIWITIHPPILFIGFAAMTVPFVFAIAALIKRDYQRWIAISLPWVLFASMSLGFGIMLGGWWAYETLGWGGFWGWDPVENGSLIPWLVCVALAHTMLVQKRTGSVDARTGAVTVGGLVKTNLFLATMAFGTILYSTFLTRSGVLGDTSVHSFVSAGNFVYVVLLAIMVLFVGLGLGMMIVRWRDLRQAARPMQVLSRENALGIGSAVLLASATAVLIGTSWPILMPLFNKPKVAVPPTFYNEIHLPIAMLLVLVNGISMTLKWRSSTPREFMRATSGTLAVAITGTAALFVSGIQDPIYVALAFGSLFALVVNVKIGAKIARGNPRFIGAYVSHAGIALMMLGIVFTGRYSVTDHVQLVQGETKQALGYHITYRGPQQVEIEKTDREKYEHVVELTRDGQTHEARPVLFYSDFNKRESAFLEPGIIYTATKDIYIAPKAPDQRGGAPTATMKKGQSAKIPFDSSVAVRFVKFDMARVGVDGMLGASLEVTKGDSTWKISPHRSMETGEYHMMEVPSTDIRIGLASTNIVKENLSQSEAVLEFASESHPPAAVLPVITLDVSIKPFISLVWLGVVVMVGGFLFAIVRRRSEVARQNTSTRSEGARHGVKPAPPAITHEEVINHA